MKYWKGKIKTEKENQYGTMDDNGSVPNSEPTTKVEYDTWVASLPKQDTQKTQLELDIAALPSTTLTTILERLRKGER